MGFYNNRKNEKSSIFMINDPDLHERDDANDKDLKIRYMLIGANIFALILFLVLFLNLFFNKFFNFFNFIFSVI